MTKMAKSVNNAKTNAKKRAKTTQNGLTPHLWPIFLADLGTPLSNDHPCSWSETNIGCFSDQPPDGRRRTIVCCRCHEGGGFERKASVRHTVLPPSGRKAGSGRPSRPAGTPPSAGGQPLLRVPLRLPHRRQRPGSAPTVAGPLGPGRSARASHNAQDCTREILYFFVICFRIHNFFENTINNGVFHKFA